MKSESVRLLLPRERCLLVQLTLTDVFMMNGSLLVGDTISNKKMRALN
ncbi:hypothetical protein SAMN05421807_101232 [Virgibacillus chiguensis]|uniref:Uncharacterized protein n=1 Tax=Virgibacillus chiguensis TaxID=411959 RepID=A0A1M5LRJ3_9BACI|nr:hypothetical protein SAMN05421807_101232 [Virgibacillus chiguensis]